MNRKMKQTPVCDTRTFLKMLLAMTIALAAFNPLFAEAQTIVNTKHNLSVTGPGTIKALTETRVCIFCHTPHNAAPSTPLWNKELKPVNYILYSSSTLLAKINQPAGPSKLCLSCHDGTIALGDTVNDGSIAFAQGAGYALPATSGITAR